MNSCRDAATSHSRECVSSHLASGASPSRRIRYTRLRPSDLATTSFAEAMCALAVTDLPFVAPQHQLAPEGQRLTLTAAGNALAGTSQLVPGELATTGAPLVVGQSYVRTDDRHRFVDGEQVDKYVEGAFVAGVVYTCQVVLANPTSSRQRIAALIQIPRGSIPLAGALATTRVLRSLLYDVAPSDPVTLVSIVALLVVAVIVASWLPARRAASVHPAEALRG